MTTLNTSLYSGASWTQKSTSDVTILTDAGTITAPNSDIQNGVENYQANLVWHDSATLSAGSFDTIDLSGLTRELFGDSYNLSLIDGVIKSLSVNNVGTGNISIDFNIFNAFNGPLIGGTDSLEIPGRSSITLTCVRDGWPVSASQRYIKISDIANSGSPYEIFILGATGV